MSSGYQPYSAAYGGPSDRGDSTTNNPAAAAASQSYDPNVMYASSNNGAQNDRYPFSISNNLYSSGQQQQQQLSQHPDENSSYPLQPYGGHPDDVTDSQSTSNQPHVPPAHAQSTDQWHFDRSGGLQNFQHSFADPFVAPSTTTMQASSSTSSGAQQNAMMMSASTSSTSSSGRAPVLRRNPSSGLPGPPQPLSTGLPSPSAAPYVNSSQLSSRSNSASSSGNKVPRMRVNMACVHCRSRKIRCDGQQPNCKTCIRLGRSCHYENISEQENVAVREKKRRSREAKQARLEALQHVGISVPRTSGPGPSFLEHRRRSYGTIQSAGSFSNPAMPNSALAAPSVLRESRSTPMNLYERQAPYPQNTGRQGFGPPPLPSPLLGSTPAGSSISSQQRAWQSQHPSSASSMTASVQQPVNFSPSQQPYPITPHSYTSSPIASATHPPPAIAMPTAADFEYGMQAAGGNPRRRGATISGFEQRVDPIQGPIWRGPIAPGMNMDPGTGMYEVAMPPAMAASQPATPDGTFPLRNASAGMFPQQQFYPTSVNSVVSGGGGGGGGGVSDPAWTAGTMASSPATMGGGGNAGQQPPPPQNHQSNDEFTSFASSSSSSESLRLLTGGSERHDTMAILAAQPGYPSTLRNLRTPALDAVRQSHLLSAQTSSRSFDTDLSSTGSAGKGTGSSGTPTTSGQPATPQNVLQPGIESQITTLLSSGQQGYHDSLSPIPPPFNAGVEEGWRVDVANAGDNSLIRAEQQQRNPSVSSSSSSSPSLSYDLLHYSRPLSLQFTPIHDPTVASPVTMMMPSRQPSDASSTANTFYSAVAQLALQSPAHTSSSHSGQSIASVQSAPALTHDYGFPSVMMTAEPFTSSAQDDWSGVQYDPPPPPPPMHSRTNDGHDHSERQ